MQVVICDSHVMYAEALSALLARSGHRVLGRPATLSEGLALVDQPADAWLTDLHFTDARGAPAIRQLRAAMPDMPIVVLTSDTDRDLLRRALDDGADGIALKTEGVQEIERLLRRVSAPAFQARRRQPHPDKVWSQLARALEHRPTSNDVHALTAREEEVMRRLSRGETTGSIAKALGVSVSTVRTHLQHLYMKADVHSRLELVAYAVRHGMVEREGHGSAERTAS